MAKEAEEIPFSLVLVYAEIDQERKERENEAASSTEKGEKIYKIKGTS